MFQTHRIDSEGLNLPRRSQRTDADDAGAAPPLATHGLGPGEPQDIPDVAVQGLGGPRLVVH